MVKSCLEHISKLILIGKSLANYLYMYVCYVCMLCMYAMYVFCIFYVLYVWYVWYVCTLCMYSMYVFYVCILCMYLMHALDLCILCMYSTYAFRIFVCKASWLSRPPGAKIHENSTCESKDVKSLFKNAMYLLNLS